jgi:hypothetical protein
MNSPEVNLPNDTNAVISLELLSRAEREVIASFLAVTDMLSSTGRLAVRYGVGGSLTAFQSLLETYRSLAAAERRLQGNLEDIIRKALTKKS